MFRAILFALVAVILISMLRMFIGIIAKGVGQAVHPEGAKPGARKTAVPTGGELKRDPVCGTYVPTANAVRGVLGGETYHYCSSSCRDKHGARSA